MKRRPIQLRSRQLVRHVWMRDTARPAARLALVCGLAIFVATGCRTPPSLPAADFSVPGWRVQQGQAVWKPAPHKPELAGELFLATRTNGDCFVQFAKTPFPLVTARVAGERWQIEFGAGEHSWRGRGEPPARFVWFQLPRAFSGARLSADWRCERQTNGVWRLANPPTGEWLEGNFFP